MRADFTRRSEPRFDLAIFLKCFGVSISYLFVFSPPLPRQKLTLSSNSIVIGGLMPRVIYSFSPDAPDWLLDRRLWILGAMSLLCPLAFLRKLDSLKFTSYISLCAVANLVSRLMQLFLRFTHKGLTTLVLVDLCRDLQVVQPGWTAASWTRRGNSPRSCLRLESAGSGTLSCLVRHVTSAHSFASDTDLRLHVRTKHLCRLQRVAIGQSSSPAYLVALFADVKVRQNTQERLNLVIGTSIGSATVIYEVLGVLGYLTFGSLVGSNVIECVSPCSQFFCLY